MPVEQTTRSDSALQGRVERRGLSRKIGNTGISISTGAHYPWTHWLMLDGKGVAAIDLDGFRALKSLLRLGVLPCDVTVAPATTFKRGVKLATLLGCIEDRRGGEPLGAADAKETHARLTEALLRHRGCEIPKNRDWASVQFGEIAAGDVRAILATPTPTKDSSE